MRFKTGSKVEVLNLKESPYGSWWTAEIISGNGHYYNVIYDICPPHMDNNIVERVPRKSLRPCPPVQCGRSWASGDVVEVFHGGSWNQSVVTRVVDSHHYYVRIFGSLQAFKVRRSSLRACQLWQDPNWVAIEKDCWSFNRVGLSKNQHKKNFSFQMLDQGVNFLNNMEEDHALSLNSTNVLKPHAVRHRGVKRWSKSCLPVQKGHAKSTGRIRAVGKDGIRHRLATGNSSRLIDKVDVVASPHIMLGKTCMHSPFTRTGYSDTNGGKRPNADVECLNTRRLQSHNAENHSSSACSSTGSNSLDMLGGPSLDLDDLIENVDDLGVSNCVKGDFKIDVNAEIHKMELHAYRSVMSLLHASGPLSWEREVLLTNLRLMLHISNDEHLAELRHLKSLS